MDQELWNYRRQALARYFAKRRTAKVVTVFLYLAVLFGVAFGVFQFFRASFTFIGRDTYFRDALTLYIYESFTLITMLLVVFSAGVTLLFSLFRQRENRWIMASPNYRLVLTNVLQGVFVSSLWPLVVIFLPALLAVAVVFGLSGWGFTLTLVSVALLTLFVLFAVSTTILAGGRLLMFVTRKLGNGVVTFRQVLVMTAIVITAFSWLAWDRGFHIHFVSFFRATDLQAAKANVTVVQQRFALLPSHAVAGALYDWQYHRPGQALGLFGILAAATVFVGLLWRGSRRWYLPLWLQLQDGRPKTKNSRPKRSISFRGGSVAVLGKKELLVFARDGRGLSWFAFLLALWFILVGLNFLLGRMIAGEGTDVQGFPAIVQALQFVTTVFFMSAFILRFVFPAFSTERRTAWILASAPIRYDQVYWAKLSLYVTFFTLLGLVVGYANSFFLGLPLRSIGVSFLLFLTALPVLVILGLSLGAFFPNFETDDPSELTNSLPGLGFIVGALAYGAAGGWSLYVVLTGGSAMPVLLFEIASILLTSLLLYRAPRALQGVDFVKNIG